MEKRRRQAPVALSAWPMAPVAFWGILFLILAAHIAAIFTENINWDEFALFARAADTARTGRLHSGGRPGLTVLLLMPLAEHCTDAVATIRMARLFWTGFTIAYVAGFWELLRRMLRGTAQAWDGPALGVGLLVLVPVFLRWSLQVRTDQPALALGLWGGVALLASRQRSGWALLSGGLFGLAFLFTQKLLYVAALSAVLAVGQHYLEGRINPWREARRIMLAVCGALAVVGAFYFLFSRPLSGSSLLPVETGLKVLAFYRATSGAVYRGMLPTLIPHLILITLGMGAALTSLRSTVSTRRQALLSLMVLSLGAAVALFHSAAFPYFWMTIGLFPAAAAALMLGPVQQSIREGRVRVLLVLVWTGLFLGSLPAAFRLLRDTQRVQRESLAFVEHNFAPADQGFQPERALFCRQESAPFPTFFAQTISSRFAGPNGQSNLAEFLHQFRSRPVTFVVESHRLDQFPAEFRHLLRASYVHYRAAVMVPGIGVEGPDGTRVLFETIVPGQYRWWARDSGLTSTVRIDNVTLKHGDTISLDRGTHEAVLATGAVGGALALAVTDPPSGTGEPFYSLAARREIDPQVDPHE